VLAQPGRGLATPAFGRVKPPQRTKGTRMTKAFRNIARAPWSQEPWMLTTVTDQLAAWFAREAKSGQALIEYALILVLVVIIVLVILIVMGNTVKNMFSNVSGSLNI
jgi:Flp pilus assembly pilin Flp